MKLNFKSWPVKLGAVGLVLGFIVGAVRAPSGASFARVLGNGLGGAIVLGLILAVIGWLVDTARK